MRWARRARKSPQAPRAAPVLEGKTPPSEHAVSDDDRTFGKIKSGTDNSGGVAEGVADEDARKDWTLRILREPVARVDSDCAVDSGSGRDTGAPSRAGNIDSGSRDGSGYCPLRSRTKSGRDSGNGPPLVVVNALQVRLPPVPAVPAAAFAEEARVVTPGRGLRAAGEAGSVSVPRRRWRNPFSWLAGYYWRNDDEVCRAPAPSLSTTPPAPLLLPPRVIVRVVYVGRAPDVARFTRAAERHAEDHECTVAAAATVVAAAAATTGAARCANSGASSFAGDDHASRPNDEEGASIEGTPPWVGGAGMYVAAVVELVRSEVRVRRACFPAVAAPERACTNGTDTQSGLMSRSATQLQVSDKPPG